MEPPPDQLQPIQDFYDRGMMLRAHAAAESVGSLRQWRGAEGRVLAGRLAMNLGAPHLGRVLHLLAWREHPHDPAAQYYYARAIFDRRGPLPAWEFLQKHGDLAGATPTQRADWLSLYAQIAGFLRDFQTAEQWLARAEAADPNHAWVLMERSDLLERQDRYEEALAVARDVLVRRPWYRPAVQQASSLLQLLDRDRDALDLLRQAAANIESAPVVMQLAALETELHLYDDAGKSWERSVELSPLMEKGMAKWLAGRRSDVAYYSGDFDRAAALAKEAGNPFHEKIAEKLLETKGHGRRVVLPVGFVRQHHMTCAPATLSALSRFWSIQADHLALAEAICYDGTPAHSERNWAEMNGFVAREFTVDWNSVNALIDAKIPFTFTTTHATSSHLQAVIGYDSLRGTLLIRDPFQRYSGEFIGDATFEKFRSTGPRGMALLPRDRVAQLDAIALPDQALYDRLYDVQQALVAHDRARAAAACEKMVESSPDHRLTLWARRSLSSYDSDVSQSLILIDKLLELFPTDPNLRLGRLSCLRVVGRREDRLAYLEAICQEKGVDPIFWEQYARELKDDARDIPRASRLLRRALRYRRREASIYHALGNLRWEQRRFDEALQLYRFAACIDDKDEGLARTWFIASRHLKQTDAVLAQMRDRFRRFGRRSSQPARTLFWAYEQINLPDEGYGVLDEALKLRPEDGELLAFAASSHARHGMLDRAAELLAAAKGKAREMTWLRTAAGIANIRGEPREALQLWRQIVAVEPLALDAHRYIALLLAETEGRAASIAHLREFAGRFEHNYEIQKLLIEWLREEGPAAVEPAVRKLMEIHSADAWARRELVGPLLSLGRFDEAAAEAEEALRLDPANPSSHYFHGLVLARAGRVQEARSAFRQAISLSADADYAISQLMVTCDTVAERKAELAFVEQELVSQTIFGDGLLAYRNHARDTLDADELLASLREALAARPDLWHAWSALIRQLADVGQTQEAHELALKATARFPLLPRLWLDLAAVCRVRSDRDGEINALNEALEINPAWGEAVRQLAEVYDRAGETKRSCELLEQATVRSPLDSNTHGALASMLWKVDRREEALERAGRAVRQDPGLQWIWNLIRGWAAALKKPTYAIDLARELTVSRAGEARSWLVLAGMLAQKEQIEERLAALDKAVALNPRLLEAHDQRAWVLSNAGRYHEALAACRPPAWGEAPPSRLRGRAAWITAEKGDIPGAIAAMQALVEEEPHYYWAWTQLANWHRENHDYNKYRSTAGTLVDQWPLDAVSRGYLGQALRLTKDRAGAKAAFSESLRLDPDYEFGATSLFDMAIDDNEVAEATRAFGFIKRHARDASALARECRLAATRRDHPAALELFDQLCRHEHVDRETLDWAIKPLAPVVGEGKVNRILHALATAPKTSRTPVARVLVDRLTKGKHWRQASDLVEELMPRGGDLAHGVAQAWLGALGSHLNGAPLNGFLRKHGRFLREDDTDWGTAGYALHCVHRHAEVIDWMADWRDRKGIAPWMLVNLAESYRAMKRDDDAHAVHIYAEGMPFSGFDKPRSIHRLWLAADAARSGNAEAATAMLNGAKMMSVDRDYKFLRQVIDAMILALEPTIPGGFPKIREKLAMAKTTHAKFAGDRELKRIYLQALDLISSRCRGIAARWWCFWQRVAVQ